MNPSLHAHEQSGTPTQSLSPRQGDRGATAIILTEQDLLAQWGFSAQEIASLLWLQQWYQTGGSDRAFIVRHLEFLRLLVRSGELEV